MADVFLSYSQSDRKIVESLADFLTDNGYDVWWDTRLVGGERFRDKILEQLAAAKSAIVIWTPDSVKSEWVIDESERAQREGKLITTRIDGLNINAIPLGFGGRHTIPVKPYEGTLAALTTLGVRPSHPPKTPNEESSNAVELNAGDLSARDMIALQHWEFIKNKGNPADFARFLEDYGDTKLAPLAQKQLDRLGDEAWGQRSDTIPALEEFARKFPNHPRAPDATERLGVLRREATEKQSWSKIEHSSDIEAVEEHISRYPGGANAKAARQKLEALKRERDARGHWRAIAGATEPRPFEEFIELYPNTAYAAQARIRLDEILLAREEADWNAIRNDRHPAPFLRFLKAHPNGQRTSDAYHAVASLPQSVEQEAWAEIKDCELPIAMQAYLAVLPHSRHAKAVRLRLRALPNVQVPPPPIPAAAMPGSASAVTSTAKPKRWKHLLFWLVTALMVFIAGALTFDALDKMTNSYGGDIATATDLTWASILLAMTAIMLRMFGPRLYPSAMASPDSRRLLFHAIGAIGILVWMSIVQAAGEEHYQYISYSSSYNVQTGLSAINPSLALVVFLVAVVSLRLTKWPWLRFVYYGLLSVIGFFSVASYLTYYSFGYFQNYWITTGVEVCGGAVLLLLGLGALVAELGAFLKSARPSSR